MEFHTHRWCLWPGPAGRAGLAALLALALAGRQALSLAAPGPEAAPLSGHVQASLVSEYTDAAPGSTVRVGLRLVHEPHWHTYWQVPGDAGLPTRIEWKLPGGASAGPLQWPVPQLLRVGPLANFGYEGTVLLPTSLTLPAQAPAGTDFTVSAHASWLVCSDVCIPESADLQLSIPLRTGGGAEPGPSHGEFVQARERIPQPISLAGAEALIDAGHLRLQYTPAPPAVAPASLHFFPLDDGRLQAAAPQPFAVEQGRVRLDLAAAEPVDTAFKTLRGVLVAGAGPGAGPAAANWAGVVELPLKAAKLPAMAAAAPAGTDTGTGTGTAGAAPEHASRTTLLAAMFGAFLGGLILNLMPCVFPVLSLKLLALVQHRHRGDPSLAAHGLAFTAGTVASFVALAGALVALRSGGAQLGWGFQLQSPLVVALLTALFFGIGLNLLGAFDVALGTAMLNSKAVQSFDGHHLRGSFATGVLAVVVASPCTAPFMGAALGFAIAAPKQEALGVFAALGLGMATPYLALTLSPALLQKLPRPGAWMQQLRQLMAFPMFATCVWLLWVLAQQVDVDAFAIVMVSLVGLGLAGWAAGQAQRGSRRLGWVGAAAGLLSVVVLVTAVGHPTGAAARTSDAAAGGARADAHGWREWSPAVQQQELAQGHAVFVDFTAAWCVTCQANKRIVLYREAVVQAFAAHGVTLLSADWTNRDDTIGRELARFNRSGVPLYVLYDRQGRPQVLPEILTESIVLDALARL